MSARHRASPPEGARLTPLPEPDPAIRATDNSGDPDAPILAQDGPWDTGLSPEEVSP